jgi:hypothetical protein
MLRRLFFESTEKSVEQLIVAGSSKRSQDWPHLPKEESGGTFGDTGSGVFVLLMVQLYIAEKQDHQLSHTLSLLCVGRYCECIKHARGR